MLRVLSTLRAAAAVAAVVALVAVAATPVMAGSKNTSLAVSASVSNNCTISTQALAFGSYDPVETHASTNLDGAGTVTIACTKGATTNIELNLGSNASGTQRRMKAGSNYLNYEIYQDTDRSTVWSTGSDKLDTGVAPSKAPRDYTAYGRVPSNQDVPAGSYTDTVTATVNF